MLDRSSVDIAMLVRSLKHRASKLLGEDFALKARCLMQMSKVEHPLVKYLVFVSSEGKCGVGAVPRVLCALELRGGACGNRSNHEGKRLVKTVNQPIGCCCLKL